MGQKLNFHENKLFKNINYTDKCLKDIEFYQCTFDGCDFFKTNLIGSIFEDCNFENCNFSMAKVQGVSFRNIIFKACKILGVDFSQCNKFGFTFSFYDCNIDYCIFFGTKLMKTLFNNCSLKETDFSEVNLSSSIFLDCDLTGTVFLNTILENVDFRTSQNYSIDPEYNRLKKAKFSSSNLEGLLYKHQLDIYNT